ncbi:MAG TPA: hypothetical protein VGN63_02460 [Flavisolibacter sp.]|jgi:hypothetical protein|nr:hypothetical protein [Flavisolibacter sp.]
MKQLLISVTFFISLTVQAQKIPATTLNLNDVEAETKIPVPFSAVQVMDVRFDRSNVGTISHVKKANGSKVKTIQAIATFPDSLQQYMPHLLEGLLDFRKESNDTLVLLVKQFRISDRIFNPMNGQYEPELLLRISFSAFTRKNGQLVRLFSVDDLISQELPTDRVPKEEVMQGYRGEALMAILQRLLKQKDWQSTGTAGFDLATVQQGIQKRFQLPLFTDSLQKIGVYKTFKEFKQNMPSLLSVKLGMNKDRLIAIADSTGKPVELKNYWGVSTGTKRYIIFRDELCELLPSDKSFYFQSYTQLSDLYGQGSFGDYAPQAGLLGGALIKSALNKEHKHFFFLNMDEETVHLEEIFGKSSLKQMQKELLK